MAELFSDEWMKKFQQEWNNEPELSGALEKIEFNSVIGYGFKGDDSPAGFIKVENGKVGSMYLERCTTVGKYSKPLTREMRASTALKNCS